MAANPYANGVSVAGTGPNNSATNWATSYDKNGNLVANTGFGYAPIYTADQFKQWQDSGNSPFPNLTSAEPSGANIIANTQPDAPTAGGGYVIRTKDGGTQAIDYKLDPKTGYYVPSAAQGNAKYTGSWLDNVIKYGSMAATAYIGGEAAWGAAGSAGPGAAAIGGSGADVGTAGAAAAGDVAAGAAPMTFDPSGMASQIADSAAQSVAPTLASNASDIAAQGAAGIAADTGGGSSSWLNDVWNAVKPSPQSIVKTGINMLTSGGQQNPLAAPGAPGSQQATPTTASAPNNYNVDQVQMPSVNATTPRTGLVGTNMGQ